MAPDGMNFESLEQMAGVTAAGLAEASAHHAFGLFRDKQFRRLAAFDALSQVEQDRIFNELVVTDLVLIMLVLEAPDLRVPSEFRDHLRKVKELIPKAYVDKLGALGVEPEHQRDFAELISLRYDEYARDRHDVRAAAMQLEAAEKTMDLDDLSDIQLLLPVQAVAIGCHHHICRGNTDGRDELFKLTMGELSKFYVEIRIPLEGGKITPLMRARMALRRMVPSRRKGKRK